MNTKILFAIVVAVAVVHIANAEMAMPCSYSCLLGCESSVGAYGESEVISCYSSSGCDTCTDGGGSGGGGGGSYPVCGDGICSQYESQSSCPADCTPPQGACTPDGQVVGYNNATGAVNPCCSANDVDASGACCPYGWGYDYGTHTCVNPCGDGVCEDSLGETHTSCPADCPPTENLTFSCPGGYTFNAGTGICESTACGASTVNQPCSGAGTTAGYYCSDGFNVDDGNPNNGGCCPTNDYWDPEAGTCRATNQCSQPSQCSQATSYPSNLASYQSNPACVGLTANDENAGPPVPGACCNVGIKYGQSNSYYYSDASGSTTNNFLIY